MGTLEQQALRLLLALDERLEPFEDTMTPIKSEYVTRLRRAIVNASKRYHRRRKIQPGMFSIPKMIENRAVSGGKVAPTPASKPTPEVEELAAAFAALSFAGARRHPALDNLL